jgi:hypothetical protein
MILLNVFLKVFLYADNIPILSYIDFVQDFVSLIDINTFWGQKKTFFLKLFMNLLFVNYKVS